MPSSLSTRRQPRRWLPVAVGAAAVLGACAFVVHRQTRRVERENPPKGRFVTAQGVRLHYTEHGAGDHTLVILHGNGTTSEEMRLSPLLDQAAERWRVLVFDRPGYGYSDAPKGRHWTAGEQADVVHAALQELGVHNPIVLGHSWGTMVAMNLGLRYPAAVGSLVLMSGYYFPSLRLDVALMSQPALPLLGTLLRHTVSPLLGRLLWPVLRWRMFSPEPTTESFRHDYPVWMSLRPSQLQASATETALMIPSAFKLRSQYGSLRVPLVLVAGDKDRELSTRWHTERLHERIADSVLHIVPGAGHMVHHVAPEEVVLAIEQAAEMAHGPRFTPRDVNAVMPPVNTTVDGSGAMT
ncbi:MAG TPA: alpha/beta hydrolase [Burkholderiaceae bacterium]|nr:alpha/beta hydrolase [Burkholderiaceae bacterium]